MNQEELIQFCVERYVANLLKYPGVYMFPVIPQSVSRRADPERDEAIKKQVLERTIIALKLADIPHTYLDSSGGIISVHEDKAKK